MVKRVGSTVHQRSFRMRVLQVFAELDEVLFVDLLYVSCKEIDLGADETHQAGIFAFPQNAHISQT